MPVRMGRGVDIRRQSEASSDASLWEEVDEADSSFADVITPPSHEPSALHGTGSDQRQNTASNPITILDSTADSSTLHSGLERELFPSGQPLSLTNRSNPAPSSSFDHQAVGQKEPWSQADLKATQYLRDEWLISAGQQRPTDLVEDHIYPDAKVRSAQPPKAGSRGSTNTSHMSSSLTSARAARAQSDSSKTSISKRSRSSLLDQLDAICSSPSQHCSPRPSPEAPKPSPRTPVEERQATASRPLQSLTNIVTSARSQLLQEKDDELSAIDMLAMPCSPPSQPAQQHITLIKDMPQELRDIYHRLAFGSKSSLSSSSTPPNAGTTARGTRGKTWHTTWQDDADSAAQGNDAAGKLSKAYASSTSASLGRGRKTAAATATPRNAARASKTRSSSATGTTAKSRFFRGRGRGRWRGRGR